MTTSEMLESVKLRLGTNYIDDTDEVILDIIEDMTLEASTTSNLSEDDERLTPYIKRAVISEYLARGGEGLSSRSEGSISSSFENIAEKLRNDIVRNGLRRLP